MRFLIPALLFATLASGLSAVDVQAPTSSQQVKDASGAVIDSVAVWRSEDGSCRQRHIVAGGTVWLELDQKGAISSVTGTDGIVYAYSRDANGRISGITAGSSAWSITYGRQDIAAISGPAGAVGLAGQKALWRGMALVIATKGQTQGVILVADPLVVGDVSISPVSPVATP